MRLLLVALTLVSACATREKKPDEPLLSDARQLGRFTDLRLVEASGLARSTVDTNTFWAQNDSGNDPVLFAFDSSGRALTSVRVTGARNRDWEALTIAACGASTCLYIGDVGDNAARRDFVTIWRVPEPRIADSLTPVADRLDFRYADGPHDVESMWVAGDSNFYLLTKRPETSANGVSRPVRIYRLANAAWNSDSVAVAQLVDSLPIVPEARNGLTWITDAAISSRDSKGKFRLAVRNYQDVYVFGIDSMTWHATALIARCSLRALREKQSGEGLTWLPNGQLMFDAEGEGARLHAGSCP